MNGTASLVSVHLAGEERDEVSLDALAGKFTITRTDAALTPYGGLAAWSGFLKHLGIIERLAEHCPVARTSPNAAPVREVLHSFQLSALVEGKRFCHVRWLTDDPAIALMMGLERVRGEDALPRLAKAMSVEEMRQWMNLPQTELYAALPERFIADWDSTVNTRYGHQEDAAVGYNPHKRGRKEPSPADLRGGAHAAVSAFGMAARRHRQRHRLAARDGKTLEPSHSPRAALAQSRRCGLWAGSGHGLA